MKSIKTEILIQASTKQVWDTLMDFKAYPNWNPFIRIKGIPKVGTYLENTIYMEGKSPQVFRPEILVVDQEREFRWKGKLFAKGLFDGEHYFQLEKVSENQTRLIHSEQFTGIFSSLILSMIREQTLAGFKAMNKALKQVIENNAKGLLTKTA